VSVSERKLERKARPRRIRMTRTRCLEGLKFTGSPAFCFSLERELFILFYRVVRNFPGCISKTSPSLIRVWMIFSASSLGMRVWLMTVG